MIHGDVKTCLSLGTLKELSLFVLRVGRVSCIYYVLAHNEIIQGTQKDRH